ncbi:hypothetical protein [Amycolatopsis solani]|uniref:hypothetical protein n=2 Tax=Amycolatopsis solani TaxID=3028615 RepID=UPI00296FA760|nr:hypothetical protein [Amycolatopsis sp. MEP2-6]
MSSTANARHDAPETRAPETHASPRTAFTAGEDPGERAFAPGTHLAGQAAEPRRRGKVALVAGHASAPGSPRARGRAPRPWAGALQRPAAKILVAGGLTLAGWLLTATLSGNTAGATEQPACPQAPAASTVDHHSAKHAKHRKSHRETGAATCAQQPETGDQAPSDPAETPATESRADSESTAETKPADTEPAETKPAATTKPAEDTTATEKPAAQTSGIHATETPATQNAGLLGGLVGGVLNVVGGTLTTVTSTVGVVTDTLSHTVLAPLTQPPANNPDAPVLLPLDDVLGPILNGGSNSGGATATVPVATTVVATTTTEAPATAVQTAAVEAESQSTGRATTHFVVVRHVQPQQPRPEQPRDSGVHAREGGGDTTPGLPGGTTAPSAPAPTAAPGHDGPGGARHAFAVHTDDVTTTQLKLIGASRDHDVDGAGREAALPTTSPD